jgi:hypothetical protein
MIWSRAVLARKSFPANYFPVIEPQRMWVNLIVFLEPKPLWLSCYLKTWLYFSVRNLDDLTESIIHLVGFLLLLPETLQERGTCTSPAYPVSGVWSLFNFSWYMKEFFMTMFYDNQENLWVLERTEAYLRSMLIIWHFLMYERKLSTKLYNNQEKHQCSSGREHTWGNELGPSSSPKLMFW